MMQSLRKKVLYSVRKKRRNRYDTRRGSGSYLDGNRFVSSCNEGSRKNGKECTTLASTYYFVHNAHRLVLIPSTLCANGVSMKERDVESLYSICHKGFCLYTRIP